LALYQVKNKLDGLCVNQQKNYKKNLNILSTYCNRWKLTVNRDKTKVLIFIKGGRLPNNLNFYYDGNHIEIVNKYSYLGIIFTSGGSFTESHGTLSGQALKAIFKLRKYLYSYVNITVEHMLDLFEKIVKPILFYSAEVWGFARATPIERVHTKFCKSVLGVKCNTQNDFIYGDLGRMDLHSQRLVCIVKYWLKITDCNDRKYVSCIYNTMLNDIDYYPRKQNWASLVKDTLCRLGFYHVWLQQSV